MIYIIAVTVLILGINTLFWSAVGAGRIVLEHVRLFLFGYRRRQHLPAFHGPRFIPGDVAILMPAHNEEAVLAESLHAASALLPLSNVHVISDGSTDHTVAIAKRFGVQVFDLNPNRGKAGALQAAIEHFQLAKRFKVVLVVDADTRLEPDYLTTGLPIFDDPEIVAVAGWARGLWDPPPRTRMGRFLVSYRSRLYAVTQILIKYGQAAKWANAVQIVPGFASMYRTDILEHINIVAPGLVIEDFNMTFELHAKKLGRIAFHPKTAVAYTQDPDTVSDYLNQIQRWTLGYWQTVRLHGLFHWGRFWVALSCTIIELVSSSLTLLVMPFLFIFSVYGQTLANTYGDPTLFHHTVIGTVTPYQVAIGFIVPDMILTVFAAIALRRPNLLILAPLFPFVRFVESYVCMRSFAIARWGAQSTGQWISPTRRGAALPAEPGRHHLSVVDDDAVA